MKEIVLTEKQSLMFTSMANELFAGGSASGGKTFCNKIIAIAVADQVPGAQIAILRNTSKNLTKNYFMGNESIPSLLAEDIKAKKVTINYTDMVVKWVETGSAIHFMHCEHVETAIENLTGLEFVLIIFDEAGLIHHDVINHSKSRLRVGSLKIENEFWKARLPRLQLTSNPSGVSHNYLKERYISPSPPGTEFTNEHGKKILFLPFGARENPHIDYEAYERELRSMGDDVKYKRLALGDWDVGEGSFFEASFKRNKNVIPRFDVPKDWLCKRSFDHGTSSPFCVVWLAEVLGENNIKLSNGRDYYLPNGSFVVFEEWYGCQDRKNRNKGIGYSPTEIAKGILQREEEMGMHKRIKAGAADNSIWNVITTYSVADEMSAAGVRFTRSDKSSGSRVRGWEIIANLMKAAHVDSKIEQPCLVFMDNCVEVITDISTIPVSKKKNDDVETTSTDHTLDALRYGVTEPNRGIQIVPTSGL